MSVSRVLPIWNIKPLTLNHLCRLQSMNCIIHEAVDHHHHQVPDLEQTLAAMPLQTSLSSDNPKNFKPLLCPPVASYKDYQEMLFFVCPYRVCLLLFQLKDNNSKPLRLHTCPKNSICLFLIVFNSDLWTFLSLNTFTLGFFSVHEILNIRLINHISSASIFFSMSLVIVQHSHP